MKKAFAAVAVLWLALTGQAQDTSFNLARGTTLSYLVYLGNGESTPITATLEEATPDSVSMTWTMGSDGGRFRMGKTGLRSGRNTYWSRPMNGEDLLLPANETILRLSAAVWSEMEKNGAANFDGQNWKVKERTVELTVASKKLRCVLIESENGASRMWILNNRSHPLILKTEGNIFGPNVELYDVMQPTKTDQ